MFNNLSNKFSQIFRNIRGKGRLTEKNIESTIRDIRIALLEADVSLPVIQDFIKRTKIRFIGKEINKRLAPGQEFIKIVFTELVDIMNNQQRSLNTSTHPPTVMLFIGPKGSGKTTTVGKLGKYLKEKKNKKNILISSTDVYRPAAIRQAKILADMAQVDYFSSDSTQPVDIAFQALNYARNKLYDILLMDTVGCLHTDSAIMCEIVSIRDIICPTEILLVVDSMTGQDAGNIAISFNKMFSLTGIILTKLDSDVRGGAALSIQYLTKKPIKFIGIGEKLDAVELFSPDRLVRKILGINDVSSLIKDFTEEISSLKIKENDKPQGTNGFTLIDFQNQIKQIISSHRISNLINNLTHSVRASNSIFSVEKNDLIKMVVIIDSMTIEERINPDIIKSSRKRRISYGSGTQIQDINRLLKQFNNMKRMMKIVRVTKIEKIMKNIKNMNLFNFF